MLRARRSMLAELPQMPSDTSFGFGFPIRLAPLYPDIRLHYLCIIQ